MYVKLITISKQFYLIQVYTFMTKCNNPYVSKNKRQWISRFFPDLLFIQIYFFLAYAIEKQELAPIFKYTYKRL